MPDISVKDVLLDKPSSGVWKPPRILNSSLACSAEAYCPLYDPVASVCVKSCALFASVRPLCLCSYQRQHSRSSAKHLEDERDCACMDIQYVDSHAVLSTDFHCIDMPLQEPRGDRKLFTDHMVCIWSLNVNHKLLATLTFFLFIDLTHTTEIFNT